MQNCLMIKFCFNIQKIEGRGFEIIDNHKTIGNYQEQDINNIQEIPF